MRWYLALQLFSFTICFCKGSDCTNADFFSQQYIRAYLDQKARLEGEGICDALDAHRVANTTRGQSISCPFPTHSFSPVSINTEKAETIQTKGDLHHLDLHHLDDEELLYQLCTCFGGVPLLGSSSPHPAYHSFPFSED